MGMSRSPFWKPIQFFQFWLPADPIRSPSDPIFSRSDHHSDLIFNPIRSPKFALFNRVWPFIIEFYVKSKTIFCSEKDRIGKKIGSEEKSVVFRSFSDPIWSEKNRQFFEFSDPIRSDSIGRDRKVIGSRSPPTRSIGSSLQRIPMQRFLTF